MQLTNPIQFIVLGGVIRYLIGVKEDYLIAGDAYILAGFRSLKQRIDILGFEVSKRLFEAELEPFIQELETIVEETEGSNIKVGADLARRINDSTTSFEKTMFAESKTRPIALPVPRRFTLDQLLTSPSSLFGKGVFATLPNVAKYDIEQAGRCIAFECPTAAAFQLMRCVEECVRWLYRAYYPNRSCRNKSWNELIKELSDKARAPRPDEILLTHLDHMRNRFRNPTDHPEKIYEIEEAEDLLHMCIDTIARCTRDKRVVERGEKAK